MYHTAGEYDFLMLVYRTFVTLKMSSVYNTCLKPNVDVEFKAEL
jgi:hypothetical protein